MNKSRLTSFMIRSRRQGVLPATRSTIRSVLIDLYRSYLNMIWGTNIGSGCKISLSARIDRTNPRGVHIGEYTGIAFDAVILSHDFLNNKHVDTHIGARCHIGARSIIFPGITIGDGCIVSAGSVVTKTVPENCLVTGNPARVVERDIKTGKWGIRIDTIPSERLDITTLMTQRA